MTPLFVAAHTKPRWQLAIQRTIPKAPASTGCRTSHPTSNAEISRLVLCKRLPTYAGSSGRQHNNDHGIRRMNIMSKGDKEKPLEILTMAPGRDHKRAIVRHPYQSRDFLAYSYNYAAEKLASSAEGVPSDDCLLLPFLSLHRQSFELQLKNTIRFMAILNTKYIGSIASDHLEEIMNGKLEKKLGHNLHKLLNEVHKLYDTLELPESFPEPVTSMILKLHKADKNGTAFRYGENLPETQEYADFPELNKLISAQFTTLCVVSDYAEYAYEGSPTLQEGLLEYQQEVDADEYAEPDYL